MRSMWSDLPDMTTPPPIPQTTDVILGSHGTAPKPDYHLPWHQRYADLLTKHQTILDGPDASPSKPGEPKHKPLDKGFFRKPGFSDEKYNIIGENHSEPSRLPENFSTIQTQGKLRDRQRSKLKPAVEISFKMAQDIEAQMRRALRIESYHAWFLGSAREMLEHTIEDPESAAKALPVILGLLISSGKSLVDSNQIVSHLLFNHILMRRDSMLDTLARDVPAEHSQRLRRHSLADSRSLFDHETIEAARKATLEARQTAVITAAASKGRASSDFRRPHQSPPNRSPRSPGNSPRGGNNDYNNNNNNNTRSQWKNNNRRGNGKKSPGGKTSPYHPKKGGDKGGNK